MTGDLAGDDPQERAAVVRGEQRDVARADVLVAGGNPLLRGGEVHPQLEAVEQAATRDELLRRALDVQDARPGGHPLRVAVGDQPAATVGVLVLEGAVDHVGDGFEAAMRMPWRALGFAGRVLHLAHLVHVDERVDERGIGAGERTAHRESLLPRSRAARWSR